MNVILGAGLAGLSAGYALTEAGAPVTVVERNGSTGGLARTISRNGFRYDLGGHRFITRDREIGDFVERLCRDDLHHVPRTSAIYLREKYFDYPLRPANALFGLGLPATCRILADYGRERLKEFFSPREIVSLEDWVVSRFGRTMFDLYFRQYSEKVWGISCRDISHEWVARRINGLSLRKAVQNAFFRFTGRDIDTLADRFHYPRYGIGQIADRLAAAVLNRGSIMTGTEVRTIEHDGSCVRSVKVKRGGDAFEIEGGDVISTIPLPFLIRTLRPSPPDPVLDAASTLHFRDLVIVTLMLRREQVTDLTWLYLPEKTIPIGRIHEPKNWSRDMAPEGHTHIVAEYFCFCGDRIWSASNSELAAVTAETLERLRFIRHSEIVGYDVRRVRHAYPLLDREYRSRYHLVLDYLQRFSNLHVAGRGGTFQYLNMDHAMRSGIRAAQTVLGGEPRKKQKTKLQATMAVQ